MAEGLFPAGCGPVSSPCPGPRAQPPSAWFCRGWGLQPGTQSCAAAWGTPGEDGLWAVSPEHTEHASLVPAGWHCCALGNNTQKLYPRSPKFLKESKKIRFLSWLQRLSHWFPFPSLAWKPKGTRVPLARDCLKRVEGFSLNYQHDFFILSRTSRVSFHLTNLTPLPWLSSQIFLPENALGLKQLNYWDAQVSFCFWVSCAHNPPNPWHWL